MVHNKAITFEIGLLIVFLGATMAFIMPELFGNIISSQNGSNDNMLQVIRIIIAIAVILFLALGASFIARKT